MINNIVTHLPDPDKGRNPAVVAPGCVISPQAIRQLEGEKNGAHRLWAEVEADYMSDRSCSE